jgi:hypothetical protein
MPQNGAMLKSASLPSLGLGVPFMPGCKKRDVREDLRRTNHRKPQTLIYKLDSACDNYTSKNGKAPAQIDASFSQLNRTHSQPMMRTTPPERNTYRPAQQPAWLKHDRQVLRFYAYYQEPVTESPTENFRIRNVTICYFLEDGTMQITENKVENSGIWPQGPFVKRHRIPLPGDDTGGSGFWSPKDLKMGSTVVIYARAFRVINCDEFTKWFYGEAGLDCGVEEQAPLDQFLEDTVYKKENAIRNTGMPKDVMEQKVYNESFLGGSKNYKFKQFLENDRKVLRFYAWWDDETRYGTRWYFTVHYYLSNDTMEINNAYQRNTGKWECPVFLTRQVIKKAPCTNVAPGMLEIPSEPLRPTDLILGQEIPIYGRKFHLYNCDEATEKFYKDWLGIDFSQLKETIPGGFGPAGSQEPYMHIALAYPPPTGFGGIEDSLGSCVKLVPKPPPKDLTKLMTKSGKILRYETVPINGLPEDAGRSFVIWYYLMDDSVMVMENKVRNSGVWEGKFRVRDNFGDRVMNTHVDPPRPFHPTDFWVGQYVTISAMPMRITRADEYTLKYMEQNPRDWPMSDPRSIREKLTGLNCEAMPPTVDPEELKAHVGHQLGFELSDHELITVLRHCSEPDSAQIHMDRVQQM